jgi:carboxymethylenebutenolidase
MPTRRAHRIAPWAGLQAVLVLCLIMGGATLQAAELVTSEIDYTGDGASMGYLAYPKDAAHAPGIILIHEWWGLNDQIRGMANRFAEQGYVALAVDLYGGQSTEDADEARAFATAVRNNSQRAFRNLSHAVAYLASFDDEKVDEERLASIGWCFGGGWSYEMALNNLGTRASVIYYGMFNPQDDLAQMRSKIIGHYGEEDRSISVDGVKEFQVRLRTQSGQHEIYIYPNAGHAFANEMRESYNPQAAEEAWKRTLDFLRRQL